MHTNCTGSVQYKEITYPIDCDMNCLKSVFYTLCAAVVSVLLLFGVHVIHDHLLDINEPQPLRDHNGESVNHDRVEDDILRASVLYH